MVNIIWVGILKEGLIFLRGFKRNGTLYMFFYLSLYLVISNYIGSTTT